MTGKILAGHRYNRKGFCEWCSRSRDRNVEISSATCEKTPQSESDRIDRRAAADRGLFHAIGRARFAGFALLLAAVPARAAEHPKQFTLPAGLIEQIGRYLEQRPLGEVIGIYEPLASCVASQTGNSAAKCPGLESSSQPAPAAAAPQ